MNKIAQLVTKLNELDALPIPDALVNAFDDPSYEKHVDLGADVSLDIKAEIKIENAGEEDETRTWFYHLYFRGHLRVHIRGDLDVVKAELVDLANRMTVFGSALTAALA